MNVDLQKRFALGFAREDLSFLDVEHLDLRAFFDDDFLLKIFSGFLPLCSTLFIIILLSPYKFKLILTIITTSVIIGAMLGIYIFF